MIEIAAGNVVHAFKALDMRVPMAIRFLDEDRLVVATKKGTLHLMSVSGKAEIRA